MKPTVFLTGATGFLGMEVLARLLEAGDRKVVALVRAADDAAAEDRLYGVLNTLWRDPTPYQANVRAVAGDVTSPGLGLDQTARNALAEEVGAVLHCAASISFDLPVEDARAINVEGTREVIGFARECKALGRLERFVHVSTAYVAGKYEGTFRERQLDAGQEFRNTYEQTKWEAEHVVARGDRPVARDRAAEHRDGGVRHRLDARLQRSLLAAAGVLARAVRRDPVAAFGARRHRAGGLRRRRARALCWTATTRASSTSCRAARRRSRTSSSSSPAIASTGRGRRSSRARRSSDDEHGAVYLPYFDMEVVFDDSRARALLEPAGIRPPRLTDYFGRLIDYAEAVRWGKRSMKRDEAREWLAETEAAAA